MPTHDDNKDAPTLEELYPEHSEEELEEARHNLEQYLSVIVQIYERVRRDRSAYRKLRRLTSDDKDGAIDTERSD